MESLYPIEPFTPAEAKLLSPHVTNLDKPVFALLNLPETTKGMLFARYSRYSGTLRRLLLDEFADALTGEQVPVDFEGEQAAAVAGRVIGQFGDDSVCQLAGVHVACEWVSNIMTKIMQRPRIGAAYLEQSTRYIAFNEPMPGTSRYRYFRHPELGKAYESDMDFLFETYSSILERMIAWNAERFPRGEESEGAWKRAVRAKAFDSCRGLLPAASLSHMGIYATGQAYEQLLLHLLAHPLPEARDYGQMLLTELKHVIPSFLSRVERDDRGGEWMRYLASRREASSGVVERLGLADRQHEDSGPQVALLGHHGSEEDLLTALLFEEHALSEAEVREAVASLNTGERAVILGELLGGREANRRHRPGRGLETVGYRFEVVSDYGAFRDLQRHRMLTCQWQGLTPDLGAEVPEDIIASGCEGEFRKALDRSGSCYEEVRRRLDPALASYALCLAYRIRFVLDLNAREAMQLIELRSGSQGHPSYRAVAHEMHRQIAGVHPSVAEAMVHVDHATTPQLERIASEIRNEQRQSH